MPLAAVLVLAVNDHVLKGSGLLPDAVTGKLSDVAGLFFFPILCAATVRGLRRLAGRDDDGGRGIALGSVASTGAVFTAVKLSPAFNALVSRYWGNNALDPMDLFALPALGLSWLWLRHDRRRSARGGLQVAAVVVAGLASMATSGPRVHRVYPRWAPEAPARRQLGCAAAEAWVAKSGKEGAGVTIELRADKIGCAVQIDRAELRLPSRIVTAASLPRPIELSPGTVEHLWLSFPFDGDAAWNANERRATLRLAIVAGTARQQWDVELTNSIEGGQQLRTESPKGSEQQAPR